MKISTLRTILHALNNNNVRYLIVGGVAVNIHGYQRMTQDIDLVVQLIPENILTALSVLEELGYKPNIPVSKEEFADIEIREDWKKTKHMEVLSLISELHPDTTIDIFISEPFDFDFEYNHSNNIQLDRGLNVRVISIPVLIEMKKKANRDRDRDDIQHLSWILAKMESDDE